jgi:ribosome-associated protein
VARSPSLTPEQAERIKQRLGARVSRAGILRVTSQRFRSQTANREAALERFVALVREALTQEPPRVAASVSRAQKQRRLAAKRRRAKLKAQRNQDRWDVDDGDGD